MFIFLSHCKNNNVAICYPGIFAIHVLGVKFCFHSRNDHVKAIQYTEKQADIKKKQTGRKTEK